MIPEWPEGVTPFPDYREERPFTYDPPDDGPDIIHDDPLFFGIDKPAGLLSVPGKTETDSALVRLRAEHRDARLVHRLDLATSGVMVFPRSHRAQRHIGLQFERRHVRKRYVALVWGEVRGSGVVDLPLRHDVERRPMQCVCEAHGKRAVTHWEAVETGDVSRLVLTPETGRSHQLRAHCLAMGHPILGDRLYAHDAAFRAAERLMLHAEELVLRHPEGGAEVSLRVETPF